MAKKIKKMTPKKGFQIGRYGKTFKHGDIIPENLKPPVDKKYLEELQPPKATLKKGMVVKVEKIKYEPETPIADEHLGDINPEFVEPLPETEDEQPQTEDEQPQVE